MKRLAQPKLTADDQLALDQYKQGLLQLEDLSSVTVRNYLSDLRQFITWCEDCWRLGKQAHVANRSQYDLCHGFGYRMAKVVPLYRLVQIMRHDSLDTTMLYVRGTKQDLQQDVEKIAWI